MRFLTRWHGRGGQRRLSQLLRHPVEIVQRIDISHRTSIIHYQFNSVICSKDGGCTPISIKSF